ncbi:MAG TPA: succinate dehydrogenase, cytochrome b556 subunit [Steroidobacteraceae bacterium]|nr:succinate dehydrogenase, cytochrome b556 subunit [Steroidobacteraceae bacterium]
MAKRDKPLVRPLSPYWQYVNVQTLHTMGFSILHRFTGLALSVGSIVLVYWLAAAASGPERYVEVQGQLSALWLQVLLLGWLFSFCYHFLNGIRHLVWDTGRGFDLSVSRTSGYAVFVAALVATAALAYVLCSRFGGGV